MVGQSIAHYRVTAKLGAGGMGEVYRATDTKLGREVALKLLPPETARDAVARARLIDEARSASAFNHPHICHIYEVNEADGVVYFAMELVEGQPLSKRIPPEGLPSETVVRFGEQIADALAHAHGHGILHRDLKSSNVVITPQGTAKVLDFGLAQHLPQEELADMTRSASPAQRTGAVAGTLPYLAPELLSGMPPNERTDIWALGVLLYEMASGSFPFEGRTGYELTSAILREPPRRLEKTPPALRTILQRCLAKEPGQRYQKAAEVRAALEATGSTDFAAPPVTRSGVRPLWMRWALPALGGVVLFALVFAVVRPRNLETSPHANTTAGTPVSPGAKPALGSGFLIRHPSANVEANELLQRAMMFTRFQYDPLRARPMLERALQLDPNFTEARVNYGLTYLIAVEGGFSNNPADIFRAEEELRRAIKENPDIARAHALLGAVHFYQGRLDLAGEEARKSLQVDSKDMAARVWRTVYGRFQGDSEGAIRAATELIESEPLFWVPHNHLGEVLREQGKTAQAVREYEKVLEQDPQNPSALRCLARAHLDAGNPPKARQTLARLRPGDAPNFLVRIIRAQLYAVEGKHALALKEMDEPLLKFADLQPFAALDAAEVYAVLGEKEKAIDWLERAMRKGDDRPAWLRIDPLLANIRQHPRFRQILNSMEFRLQQRTAPPTKQP